MSTKSYDIGLMLNFAKTILVLMPTKKPKIRGLNL